MDAQVSSSSSQVLNDNGVPLIATSTVVYPSHEYDQTLSQHRVPRSEVVSTSEVYSSNSRLVQQNTLTQRLMQRSTKQLKKSPKLSKSYKQPRHVTSAKVMELRKALDLSKYIKQVESLIMQPIKIPSTVSFGMNKRRKMPSKPKQDLLSIKDVWRDADQRRNEMKEFYNTRCIDSDREFLLNLLLDESDEESDSEQITEEDFAFMLEHRREAKKLMKAYHHDYLNTQYQYYSSGMLSETDRYMDAKRKILDIHEDMMFE
ncbi:unnamed protein product [Bursaphelenchus xylophilus]|uniref:(pine wood nematode) hypothetical protein n=1 Tax=Bursaphelenchus xylophilus TaxID=6326 RepID=A0A1I7RQX0_BURXY|nr:unnamed protein product [Bursaphelenchus xylophilus]CAG9130721.1 unnamed protein product [Bursaphelenchus xylophilus]